MGFVRLREVPVDRHTEERQRPITDQSIDDQIEGSFPASDPPSYNAGDRIGEPLRKHPEDPQQ
jgi:hypothetical protein